MADPLDFGPDNSGHDTDCDCKACLIDTWHAEVDEIRAIRSRYVKGLKMIVEQARWCKDYAMCDHVGCESAHRAYEIAEAALNVESVFWPIQTRRAFDEEDER
jgi:hypothetical protein